MKTKFLYGYKEHLKAENAALFAVACDAVIQNSFSSAVLNYLYLQRRTLKNG